MKKKISVNLTKKNDQKIEKEEKEEVKFDLE
jgi:hypothetical protein